MRNKQYFTINEALEDIKNVLENGYNEYLCDLHNEVFNTEYYITGTYQAKQALNEYGVFEAIEEIQEYEKFNFGEIHTDLSSPEKVANMLYYLKGNEAMQEIQGETEVFDEEWNNEIDDEVREVLIQTIDKLLLVK